MDESAIKISQLRREFIEQVEAVIKEFAVKVETDLPTIQYRQGWHDSDDLKERLLQDRMADRNGIHRSDLVFQFQGLTLAAVFSRGAIKQYVSMLLLAQAQVIYNKTGIKPLILIDDFAAEVDSDVRARLVNLLMEQGMQSFLTVTDETAVTGRDAGVSVFHVEHGNVQKVIK